MVPIRHDIGPQLQLFQRSFAHFPFRESRFYLARLPSARVGLRPRRSASSTPSGLKGSGEFLVAAEELGKALLS